MRLKPFGLNLVTLVKLIDAGCFDGLGSTRASLRPIAAAAIDYADMLYGPNGQQALLDLHMPKPQITPLPDDLLENLNAEHDALGLMISGSPLSLHKAALSTLNALPLSEIATGQGTFTVAGIIKSLRVITTKRGQPMAFMPELPEVETVRAILSQILTGKTIAKVTLIRPKNCATDPKVFVHEIDEHR